MAVLISKGSYRLVLGGHKMKKRSPHSPARILKVYTKAYQAAFSPDGLNSTLLTQGCVLTTDSSVGTVG